MGGGRVLEETQIKSTFVLGKLSKLDGVVPLMTDPLRCNPTTRQHFLSNNRNDTANASGQI